MTILDAIHQVCDGLPRHSPGSESTTLKVLRRFGRLSRRSRVVDLGCGVGVSTRVLARRFDGPVVAVEAHQPYLDQLTEALRAEGTAEHVVRVHSDFTALDEHFGSFDLLWAEAASQVLGFEHSLTSWSHLLAAGGRMAVSELCYRVDQPSDEVKAYWSTVYPQMRTVIGNTAAAERAGYNVVDTFELSNRDYRSYYGPIKSRIAELRALGEMSPELAVVVAELETEMALHERHGDEFGWVFFLLEKPRDVFDAAEEGEAFASEFGFESEGVPPAEVSKRMKGAVRARPFDAAVAPGNASAHQHLEQGLAELIQQCGLERASRVFAEVESSVERAVKHLR